jgi:hypothetical protein
MGWYAKIFECRYSQMVNFSLLTKNFIQMNLNTFSPQYQYINIRKNWKKYSKFIKNDNQDAEKKQTSWEAFRLNSLTLFASTSTVDDPMAALDKSVSPISHYRIITAYFVNKRMISTVKIQGCETHTHAPCLCERLSGTPHSYGRLKEYAK